MAKKKSTGAAAIVETPEQKDLVQATDVKETVLDFFRNLAGFFATAREFEEEGQQALQRAQAVQAPTTDAEDDAIQRDLVADRARAKGVEEHWKNIKGAFYKLHRLISAAEQRGKLGFEQAVQVRQQLTDGWAADKARRDREEAERLRLEAEAKARADREAEQAKLEADAIAAEEAAPELSVREQLFVDYMVDSPKAGDPTACAQVAGFKDPAKHGARLMGLVKIVEGMEAKRNALAIRKQASAKAAAPLDVQVPASTSFARPKASRTRETHKGVIVDKLALIHAICTTLINESQGETPDPYVPVDLLDINQSRLDEYASQMKAGINRWAGVRYELKRTSY